MRAGYNHDILRAGHRLHVQTEDGGAVAGVVTHLFFGGRVLAVRRSHPQPPADATPADADVVRALMQRQHRDLVRAALRGDFDDQLA